MRIISGIHKGKVINPPKGLPVRPTTDFAKTGLFNILASRIDFEETNLLDLCCGTGNITLEFASRGAKSITAVDLHAACVKFVSDAARSLNFNNIRTFKADVFKFLDKNDQIFDVVFMDPPYEATWIKEVIEVILKKKIISADGLLIVEHGDKTDLSEIPFFKEKRNYGNVNFSIFIHNESNN